MEFGFIVLLIVAAVIVIGVFWGLSEKRVRPTPLSIDPVDKKVVVVKEQKIKK